MAVPDQERDWLVLLIGGSSGVGKTGVASAVARAAGASVILANDIRLAVQQVTTARTHPALHRFEAGPDIWKEPPEVLLQAFIETSEALQPALEVVIGHHLVVSGVGPIVLEGDNILPALAAAAHIGAVRHFSGYPTARAMRSVFLFEPEESVLLENMRIRDRGFNRLPAEEQSNLARASWLYGLWLREEARSAGLATVEARPWTTLADRVIASIAGD